MYVRKKYQRLLDLSDKQFIISSQFQKFIEQQEKCHNLIIKRKNNRCYCTCCNNNFVLKTKINGFIKCPNCKQKLLVKSDRLQRYIFKDNLQFLDKIEDTFILRTFELYSSYNNNKVSHCITEYMRTILDDNRPYDFVSNQVSNHMGYMYVAHWQNRTHWRGRNYRWSYRDIIGIVCPYNIKKLLKNTDLKYSQLDKFIKKENDYIDFVEYFTRIAHYPSFELLVKMKLYNLAKEACEFSNSYHFKKMLEAIKTHYSFVKRYNLTLSQLKIMMLINKEDIKLINNLLDFNNLEELSNYVNLEEAYNKVLSIKGNREYEYLDYLKSCKQLQYDMKDKKILFPKDLEKSHDKVMELLEIVENEANDKLIKERLEILTNYIYENKKYIVYPAPSVSSLINESKQLNHCVNTDASRYALAETNIYFLREITNKEKSLVTVEVKGNNILQARAKYNNDPSKEQLKFLDVWKSKVLDKAVA